MKETDKLIEGVDPTRREFVRKAIAGSFVIPAVASFSMATMGVSEAHAQSPNGGGPGRS